METDPAYGRAYLVMRFATAVAALTMPVFVVLGTLAVDGHVFGSLSEYYHDAMRDFFVGALWAVGLLLVTYRLTTPRTAEFAASTVTGVGAIVLAFFPTSRPGTDGRLGCGRVVDGRPCTPIQQVVTETGSQVLHVVGTVLFLGGAVVVCVVWARATRAASESRAAEDVAARYAVRAADLVAARGRSRTVYVLSAAVMAAALVFQLAIGFPLDVPYSLLVVELVCIAAFGTSWLAESLALLTALTARSPGRRRFAAARLAMTEASVSDR
ncbi:hypothetical protein ACXR2U_21355 [Jatrophihabitans sp. YIM 134969]